MQIDLKGRLKNITLPYHKCLLPVYEAVINAFQSIEETDEPTNHSICIKVLRDKNQAQMDLGDGSLPEIIGFSVEDSGPGFHDINLNSFLTSDSTFKADKGGKGIGRFLWLKAFEKVEIDSHFEQAEKINHRKFEFSERLPAGVSDTSLSISSSKLPITQVSLYSFKQDYLAHCPKSLEILANRIIEHCVVYFLSDECPKIVIEDDYGTVDLKTHFGNLIKTSASRESFKIEGLVFNYIGLKFYSSDEIKNKIYYCAHNREVKSENIATYIPNLNKRLKDENGTFRYGAFIFGDYLDEHVNQERTEFAISSGDLEDNPELGETITLKDIRQEALKKIKKALEEDLKEINEEKKGNIERFISSTSPQYRPILKYSEEIIDNIPPGLTDEKLDLELHKARYQLEVKLKEESKAFIKQISTDVEETDDYRKNYDQFIEKLNDLGKATLAQYILHRRVVLDILDKMISKDVEGKYELEKAVHSIIFPLKKTSDEVSYDRQNLWVIDEKLSYHHYLASDVPLKSQDALESNSTERPDLVVFNLPFAFTEGSQPFSSIVIIEFKRPGRNSLKEKGKDPVTQVYNYVREIRGGKAKDRTGKQLNIPDNIPFYSYVICDLTPDMVKIAENAGLIKSPDGLGYFGFNNSLSTYVEIVSYSKLIGDAKKRNRVLFEKLNLAPI